MTALRSGATETTSRTERSKPPVRDNFADILPNTHNDAAAQPRGNGFWLAGSVIRSASCVDRAAEKGHQPLDGSGPFGDDLGRAKATGAGLLGQLGTGERQRLFGEMIRQVDGLLRGLREVPAMGEEVVEPDPQSLGTGGGPKRAAVGPLEDAGRPNAACSAVAESR